MSLFLDPWSITIQREDFYFYRCSEKLLDRTIAEDSRLIRNGLWSLPRLRKCSTSLPFVDAFGPLSVLLLQISIFHVFSSCLAPSSRSWWSPTTSWTCPHHLPPNPKPLSSLRTGKLPEILRGRSTTITWPPGERPLHVCSAIYACSNLLFSFFKMCCFGYFTWWEGSGCTETWAEQTEWIGNHFLNETLSSVKHYQLRT